MASRTITSRAVKRPKRRAKKRGIRWSWRARIILVAVLGGCGVVAWAAVARVTAPEGDTAQSRFDAIAVLGGQVDSDGNLEPAALARTTEGVREYERGVAPRLIFTGGMDHGRFVEAATMARAAEAEGVPASAVFLEPDARNTMENACLTARLMQKHGWSSAEVVTSPSHLPRAGLIFSNTSLAWRMHAAPPLEEASSAERAWAQGLEVLKTARYLVYAQWADRCSR